MAQAQQLGLPLPAVPPGQLPFSGIYAVGDNPAADVRGANQAGGPWVSVLVRTGASVGWTGTGDGWGILGRDGVGPTLIGALGVSACADKWVLEREEGCNVGY